MPYNSQITRNDAAALIPEEVSREILKEATEQSFVLQLARRLPNMSTKTQRMPVLNSLVEAYFVNGDTGLKQTSEADWTNVYLTAEELAVIVPIPEAVLDDSNYDIWAEAKPQIAEAFGRAVDKAMARGVNKPASWPTDLKAGAIAAGHTVDLSAQTAGGKDLYDVILGEGGVLSLVEEDGFAVNGHVGSLAMRAKLRGLRDANKLPIFQPSMREAGVYELDGEPMHFPKNGSMDASDVLMFSGDWSKLVYAIRQDVTYKVLDQAVIQDGTGAIVYNLAQQDMVALRAVFRLGFALPNPVTNANPAAGSRYPFAVLVP